MSTSSGSTKTASNRSGNFAADEWPHLFRSGNPSNPQNHWLEKVLNPFQRHGVNVFPDAFGVSLVEFVEGRGILRWSTCFEEKEGIVIYCGPDDSDLRTVVDNVRKELDEALTSSDSNLRVLLVHCLLEGPGAAPPVWQAKLKEVIDTIGKRLKLDPLFFVEHFDMVTEQHESAAQALPSSKDYLQLQDPHGGYVTATTASVDDSGVSTAVVMDSSMLGRTHNPWLTQARSFLETSCNMRPGEATENHIIMHVVPYIKHLLRVSLAMIKNLHHCTDVHCHAMPDTWRDLQSLSRLLYTNLKNIDHTLARQAADPGTNYSLELMRLLYDVVNSGEGGGIRTVSTTRT
ncbi:hypothetical protein BJX63DRAFT_415109 [Aspergillus granulosus]|uniref:Uncharacterized protein n=1 Tax=Aspergillus granulosus TaxID=176169 RepID=A0ABR4GU38_9EURO